MVCDVLLNSLFRFNSLRTWTIRGARKSRGGGTDRIETCLEKVATTGEIGIAATGIPRIRPRSVIACWFILSGGGQKKSGWGTDRIRTCLERVATTGEIGIASTGIPRIRPRSVIAC
ncbi:hypothetical protein CDAR_96511 [Caerostris darwini]|uniref:Uncharacterized protein n=1 Tax=Caerostris darwini TaxID=1538125 RepID=A0AAV4QY28_9ARAC|nr:hypothetical protein CDAR_96511 [Caerostris darwini]